MGFFSSKKAKRFSNISFGNKPYKRNLVNIRMHLRSIGRVCKISKVDYSPFVDYRLEEQVKKQYSM